MVEKPVFDLKIKHFSSLHGCGTSSFVVLGILYNELKTNTHTLMAQEGAIVQITHCFILIYIKTNLSVIFILRLGTEQMTFP